MLKTWVLREAAEALISKSMIFDLEVFLLKVTTVLDNKKHQIMHVLSEKTYKFFSVFFAKLFEFFRR